MGILYQNLPDDDDQFVINHTSSTRAAVNTASTGVKKTTKKKRSLTSSDVPLEPYIGVPKMTIFNYKDTSVVSLPDTLILAKHLDLMWMISHTLKVGIFPMWVSFNSIFYKDDLPKQTIRYMPNLKEPITSLAVVRQTLGTTLKCGEECNQEYGIVTYDLNGTKPAMQIQVTESPRFDNVFTMLGAFHIVMAFFKALGKFTAESGGPDMLTETGVIASGSLNGVLTGKHFNHCKRIHPLLALAFESLHFKAFLKTRDFEEDLWSLMSMLQTSSTEGYNVGRWQTQIGLENVPGNTLTTRMRPYLVLMDIPLSCGWWMLNISTYSTDLKDPYEQMTWNYSYFHWHRSLTSPRLM